jgi:putative flippase GtrA
VRFEEVLLKMRRETALQSLRYLAVSGSGVTVNFAIFAILSWLAVPTLVGGALAFAGACEHNVTWHARITFDAGTRSSRRQSARFFALSLATLGASLVVLAALESAGVPALIAQGAGIAVASPLNLLGCRSWVFRGGRSLTVPPP